MKNLIKNNLMGIIIGMILCTGIVYAVNYNATDISYNNDKSSSKNVNEALDELYNISSFQTNNLGTFGSYHWNSDGSNYITSHSYDISNCNKVQLTVSSNKPDGTITIATEEETLLSTNSWTMENTYTFDVSSAETLTIQRIFTYGQLSITVTKVE